MALTRASHAFNLGRVLQYTSINPSKSRIIGQIDTQTRLMGGILSASISIPAFSLNIPGLLSEIWEGILKAVPKKKTSHMKKRHRQLAGKALKDVNAVNTCPGCGKPKKAHTLCPYCVAEIKESWKQAAREALK